MRILVVEDDAVAAEYVRKGLMEAGHVVDLAPDGDLGLEMARAADYDALILDRMLPKRDGLEVLAEIREDGDATPVLILSALGEVDQKVEGLRAGGDDYLAKPYSFTELLARVEAIGRRSDPTAAVTKLKVGGLEMDLLARTVRRDGQKILLQPKKSGITTLTPKQMSLMFTSHACAARLTKSLKNLFCTQFAVQVTVYRSSRLGINRLKSAA